MENKPKVIPTEKFIAQIRDLAIRVRLEALKIERLQKQKYEALQKSFRRVPFQDRFFYVKKK